MFRKQHIGQSKASVAAQAIKSFCPNVIIKADMSNVMLPEYDLKFFKGFDIVLNGLDNLEARRHVNKMCVTANVPLVESGTAGYLGQVTVHVARKIECFDCLPKPTQKSYAVCTIRRTPDKPIHCIVWSKEVAFHGLFGDGDLADIGEDLVYSPGGSVTPSAFAKTVFKKLFHDNIQQLLLEVENSEEDVWKGQNPPTPLEMDAFEKDIDIGLADDWVAPDHHDVMDEHKSAQMFVHSIKNLVTERAHVIGSLEFDKDDNMTMQFVASASNLRSHCYGIELQSYFQAKGMAGNIIHAIATTNAIVSGLIVVQAMKILASNGDVTDCHAAYIQQYPSNKKIITPVQCLPPNPDCNVCSNIPLILQLNTQKAIFGDFLKDVVKGDWGFTEFILDNGSGFLYEEGDFLDEDEIESNSRYLSMTFDALPGGGIVNNSIMTITDEGSSLRVPVLVSHNEAIQGFQIDGTLDQARQSAARVEKKKEEEDRRQNEPIDLHEDEIIFDVVKGPSESLGKRKREDEVVLVDDSS